MRMCYTYLWGRCGPTAAAAVPLQQSHTTPDQTLPGMKVVLNCCGLFVDALHLFAVMVWTHCTRADATRFPCSALLRYYSGSAEQFFSNFVHVPDFWWMFLIGRKLEESIRIFCRQSRIVYRHLMITSRPSQIKKRSNRLLSMVISGLIKK